ncbi:glycosyltransferase family 2 protein [Gemmatimonas sp.]|uniref:glycosyltransferase family 2 protein n=1 Tax=Gemmatimonas sp. TaxID=1962908 RepID=UPI00356145D2
MAVVGVSMVRDEADIIPAVIKHMWSQVDALLIADNGSIDGTREMLEAMMGSSTIPFVVVDDSEVGYYQSRKMTGLAAIARDLFEAEWIVPFDADEIWTHVGGWPLKDVLPGLKHDIIHVPLFDHVATGALDSEPIGRMGWRRPQAAPLPKTCFRWKPELTIGMGNHDVRIEEEIRQGTTIPGLMIHHFPYRSTRQVITKIRNGAQAYAATDLPDVYGGHWRGWGSILEAEGEPAIEKLFRKWHWREFPERKLTIDGESQPALVFDPVKLGV